MPEGIESRIATHGGITFTVNTAVTDVALLLTGTPDLSVNAVIKYLEPGENCIIKGFCMTFPYQFGQGEIAEAGVGYPMLVQLGWRDLAGANGSVNEVGDTGLIQIPDPNYWYDMDVFVPFPAGAAWKWHFEITGLAGYASMINAPAVLNTEILDVAFHLKIFHTLPLIA